MFEEKSELEKILDALQLDIEDRIDAFRKELRKSETGHVAELQQKVKDMSEKLAQVQRAVR